MDAETITKFLTDELGVDQPIGHGDDLLASDALDSQGIVTLVSFLEEREAIQVADEDLVPENFRSVDAILEFVKSKRG